MKKANNWRAFAQEDLVVAEAAFERKVFNQVCFHAQQGVEKMLKAFLANERMSVPRTHFLTELLVACIRIAPGFKKLRKKCAILDGYYIPTRYPDALPGALPEGLPDKGDAKQALFFLREITEFIDAKLGK